MHDRWEPFVNQNQVVLPHTQPVTICFITLETRGDKEEYVKLHNRSFQEYVERQNRNQQNQYSYEFITECDSTDHRHNIYWCKFFQLRKALEQNKYDYVVWVDSDTVITDYDLDFAQLLKGYQSHWFVSLDNLPTDKLYPSLNAGVVAVRNSDKGKEILQVITNIYNQDDFQTKCVSPQNTLNGAWSGMCYEQGVMNWVLYSQYSDHLTILPEKYIQHGNACKKGFIVHMFQSPSNLRTLCFNKFISQ
jgi:hypothetical protein